MNTNIRLGMVVVTSDGKRIGKVDRLVVDPDHQELLEIVVHQHLPLPAHWIVNYADIGLVEDDTLVLKIDAEAAQSLPRFSAHEYTVGSSVNSSLTPFGLGAGPTTNQPLLYRAGAGRHAMRAARTNLYQETVLEGGVVEVRSSLPDAAVVLDKGADVLAADDSKIGTVDEIIFDERGDITGFVVRAGFFMHHDITVPIGRVDSITHRYVRLNVMSDEIGMEMAVTAS
ncbi:MAG TPA: PRC-barrel domain-containing protein [Thermomicrobiales bacterium]|nr:PRC-barrel domain-containing protein [Thermomicrobiales bacterium]